MDRGDMTESASEEEHLLEMGLVTYKGPRVFVEGVSQNSSLLVLLNLETQVDTTSWGFEMHFIPPLSCSSRVTVEGA